MALERVGMWRTETASAWPPPPQYAYREKAEGSTAWVPTMQGGLVMAQHAWSPAWTCGQIGRTVHKENTDPFEGFDAIRKVKQGWLHDDKHRHMTTYHKEYLPYHQRVIKVPGQEKKKQLIASRWQTPRVHGVKVTSQTETARIMAFESRTDGCSVAAKKKRSHVAGQNLRFRPATSHM